MYSSIKIAVNVIEHVKMSKSAKFEANFCSKCHLKGLKIAVVVIEFAVNVIEQRHFVI